MPRHNTPAEQRLRVNVEREKRGQPPVQFGSIIEDRNEPTRWGGRICIGFIIFFISYLIARTVATFVWGV